MRAPSSLLGPRPQLDYIAVHDYSCNATETLLYLRELHDKFGYPIWLTEFACGDGSAHRPTADHLAYMKEVVPLLDAADYVYRYSWMSAHDPTGRRGLVSNGTLTELGQVYNSL